MKLLVVLLAVMAVVAAEEDFDFANARPIQDFPFFHERFPAFKTISEGTGFGNGGRIVNGEIATPGQFPYQVALLIQVPGGTALCGGSVVSATRVLTAAHCIDGNSISVQIIFGAHDRTIVEPEQVRQTVPAANFAIHPEWTPNLIRNDIALIRLVTAITFTPRIQPVAMATAAHLNTDFTGQTALVSGFGRFQEVGTATSPVVRFVDLPVISNAQCALTFPGNVVASNVCTSGAGGRSTCNGDSGGPLTVVINGQITQIGIVSFGAAAGCHLGHPAAFARVTSFLDWINANMA